MNDRSSTDRPCLPEWQAPDLEANVSDCWLTELADCEESNDAEDLAALQHHGIIAGIDQLLRAGHPHPGGRLTAATIHRVAAGMLAQDLAWQRETRRIFQAFAEQGIAALLLKGAALGQYLYPKSYLRIAGDIDILIQAEDKQRARQLLYDLGGRPWLSTESSLLTQEITIELPITSRLSMPVDLHWQLSNRPLLVDIFDWRELWQHSRALEDLDARALHPAHALLHACMHRIGHHGDDHERLIWLSDIHLLWLGFGQQGQQELGQMAADKGIAGITLDALLASSRHYTTAIPESIRQGLAAAARGEATAKLLHRIPGPWFDLRHTRGLGRQLRFATQLLFPTPAYMKARYQLGSSAQLPWAYLRRTVGGIMKQLRATIGHNR